MSSLNSRSGDARSRLTRLAHDLFDEIRFALVPVILGSGAPPFGRNLSRRNFTLVESRPLAWGCVILRYQPGRS